MKRRTKVLTAVAVAVPVAVGAGATAYAAHYRDLALPGSSVAGIDVAGMTRAEVAAALRQKADGIALAITLPDGSRTVRLGDLGTTVDVEATVARLFDANTTWSSYAEALVQSRAVDVVTTSDRGRFDAYVAGLGKTYARPATNAVVALAEDAHTFTVTSAVTGRYLDAGTVRAAATKAAATLTSGTAATSLVDQAPALTTESGRALAAEANAMVKARVKVTDGDRAFTASARDKASWVTIPAAGASTEPGVDETRVKAWVTKLTKSVDSAPSDGLRYFTSTGQLLRVVTPAKDGRKVTNAGDVVDAVVTALDKGTSGSAKFATKVLPATWAQRTLAAGAEHLAYPAVAGEKWIDVNLSRHTMTAYVGGSTAFGPVAMVNGAPATPTDIGTFHIYLKNPMMTMRGQNADGTSYETPDVPWSSFFNGGEALHGAYWRKTFGYAASHGCVNLPIPTAKWVYDWAPIGTPVVTHN